MNQEPLNPHYNQDFICNNCRRKFYQTTAYSPKLSSGFLEETYCGDCVEITDEKPINNPKSQSKTKRQRK